MTKEQFEQIFANEIADKEIDNHMDSFLHALMCKTNPNVYYVCDRRACDQCDPRCHHTKDISHAKYFEKDEDGDYHERGGS